LLLLLDLIHFFSQKAILWIPVMRSGSNFTNNYDKGRSIIEKRGPPTRFLRHYLVHLKV
jgi:hypothetical protein